MDPLLILALAAAAVCGVALGVVVDRRATAKRLGDADELAKRTGIDAETLQEVLNILKSEFE